MKNKAWILLMMVLMLIMGLSAAAQTARKKPARKNPPVSSPTPPLRTIEPEIISRAEDENNLPLASPPPQNAPAEESEQPKAQETIESKLDNLTERIKKISSKINAIESQQKTDLDAKQKRLLLNLDILTRAEQRAEALRKQLFEMIDKENDLKKRFDEAEYNSRPEVIERQTNMIGSLRPEELRESKRRGIETEKANISALLRQIQGSRTTLEDSILKADLLVEKLRLKLEKEIDDALAEDAPPN